MCGWERRISIPFISALFYIYSQFLWENGSYKTSIGYKKKGGKWGAKKKNCTPQSNRNSEITLEDVNSLTDMIKDLHGDFRFILKQIQWRIWRLFFAYTKKRIWPDENWSNGSLCSQSFHPQQGSNLLLPGTDHCCVTATENREKKTKGQQPLKKGNPTQHIQTHQPHNHDGLLQ